MLTWSFQRTEDHKSKSCQKHQKEEIDEEIPKEDVSAKFLPLVVKETGHQWMLHEGCVAMLLLKN